MGVPVTQVEQVGSNQLLFKIASKEKPSKDDLLTYSDSYTCAKWIIKHEAIANDYHASFIPLPSSGSGSHLTVNTKTSKAKITEQQVYKHLQYYAPTLNSVRMFAKDDYELLSTANDGGLKLGADANLYMAFVDLFGKKRGATEDEFNKPASFEQMLVHLDSLPEETAVSKYYKSLLLHEK